MVALDGSCDGYNNVKFEGILLEVHMNLLMVKCLALMKASKYNYMMVKCLVLYLEIYME